MRLLGPRWSVVALTVLLSYPPPASSYSVLAHEAIIDTVWLHSIRPAVLQRFPQSTDEQLREAHAYAYGGCIIQDLGYYPFGSHFFSDLLHYVRSAEFVEALLDESTDIKEYAFALGGVAHYGADVAGHSIAVNKAVPILYPKLRKKFGSEVTYADSPAAHLKTEFGFDVLQVARGHYAPQAYHEFIGFAVSKDLLDRAFQKTYGLMLKDLFRTLDLALGTYRLSVSKILPSATRTAWTIKKDDILNARPGTSRKQFLYNLSHASFEKDWGMTHEHPGLGARILAFFFRISPKFGPFKSMTFRVPTRQVERMFEDSFDAAADIDRRAFAEAMKGALRIANLDLDTGKPVSLGEYVLTDHTYDKLLVKLAAKKFEGVTAQLRENILNFYAQRKTPDPHGITAQLEGLKSFTPPK